MPLNVAQMVHDTTAWLLSRRALIVFRGTLAYMIVIILPFIYGFDRLMTYENAYTGMALIVIATFPGKSIGECLGNVILGQIGVGVGAGCAAILAKLRTSLPAQAAVFAVMVYILAVMKALSMKFFGFSLLAILMAFNGVYTSIMLDGFVPKFDEDYFKGYLWGAAISAGVSIFFFPFTAETGLRETLVSSLDHIATFSHLLAKTYSMNITEEEKAARDRLAQSLRADGAILNAKLGATVFEITWSRWTMGDYDVLVGKTRTMQKNLITLYSSLAHTDARDFPVFKTYFLPNTQTTFHQLWRDVHRTISEIQAELKAVPAPSEPSLYERYFNIEREERAKGESTADALSGGGGVNRVGTGAGRVGTGVGGIGGRPQLGRGISHRSVDVQMREISDELRAEIALPDGDEGTTNTNANTNAPSSVNVDEGEKREGIERTRGCADKLRPHFEEFQRVQRNLITQVVISGKLHGADHSLRLTEPRSSILDTYGLDHIRGREKSNIGDDQLASDLKRRAATPVFSSSKKEKEKRISVGGNGSDSDTVGGSPSLSRTSPDLAGDLDSEAISSNHSLMRVFSLLFALDQFTTTLSSLHTFATKKNQKGKAPGKSIHFHIPERIIANKAARRAAANIRHHTPNPSTAPPTTTTTTTPEKQTYDGTSPASDITMLEALALLEGRTYVPKKVTLWQRLAKIEALFRTPTSIYGAKTAAAALVFGSLIWAEHTRSFFLRYNLTGSLLTLVVALAPTLGQSLRTFVFQIVGSGVGILWAAAGLEMFKDVGGYHFNPYGVCSWMFILAFGMSWLLYEMPQYFTLVLLGLNGGAVLTILEQVYVQHQHKTTFGSPILRAGRQLAGLSIALAIVLAFQLLVLRNPARRTLRKALAGVVFSTMSYNTILQAYIRGTIPADHEFRAPEAAIERVLGELKKREAQLQEQILACMPLIAFSRDEPQLTSQFQVGVVMKIIRANQALLDRLQECRSAIGTEAFSKPISRDLIQFLSPYRRYLMGTVKSSFVLCAASLSSKTPLPQENRPGQIEIGYMLHDALLQSQRFAETPEGKASINSGEFTRYWFYLLTLSSIIEQLHAIEEGCQQLFGTIEEDSRMS